DSALDGSNPIKLGYTVGWTDPMRVNELVEHVVAGGNIEDEFVEAKAVWPTLDKAGQLTFSSGVACSRIRTSESGRRRRR
ncbi:hypothetical protein, partial [Nocardia gipuzkoensis]